MKPLFPTESKLNSERIVLGIDPGTNVLGYGLIAIRGRKVEMLTMGAIDLRKVGDIYLKLGRIYERILAVIDEFHPDELAIEAPFFGKNVQSMLKLGRAQGVVIAAAIARHIPVHEYAPSQIKQAITGSGAASISPEAMLPFLDATDALAAAYCHHISTLTRGVKGTIPTATLVQRTASKGAATWEEFAKANANRIRK